MLHDGSKVMANVKVFRKVSQRSMSRSQGQKFWYQCKGFAIRNTHAKTLRLLALMVQKFLPRTKFLKSRSKVSVMLKRSEMLVPVKRPCHKECTCEISKL